MSDYRRADEVWEEDEVDEDDAKTLVARNPLRDPAEEEASVQASEGLPDVARDPSARDSVISIRESEIELVRDGDVLTGSGAAELARGAEPGATPRPSVEVLRDSEVDRLRADVASAEGPDAPAHPPHAEGKPALKDEPSISVTDLEIIEETTMAVADREKGAASIQVSEALPAPVDDPTPVVVRPKGSRNEATERVSTLPRTHPFANSIAPTAAPKSVPPAAPRTSGWSLALVAVVFLLLGGALARLRDGFRTADGEVSSPPTQVAAAARVAEPSEPAPAGERAEAAEHAPSTALASMDEAAAPAPAEEVAPTLVSAESSAAKPRRGGRSLGADEASPVPSRRERRKAQASEGEIPAQPPRDAVVAVMDAMRPELERCTGGRRGIAEVSVTVRPEGRVSYAVVDGSFAGSPEGTCMAQALRQARFPAFSDPMLRVKYPFQF